ncbi:MAG TPA: DUF1800 domain-containing protein [Thermoanaerobaculia bacterium]|nr:DUF1800 domain-containing protein [Thermoanaerobaculia bacterium]
MRDEPMNRRRLLRGAGAGLATAALARTVPALAVPPPRVRHLPEEELEALRAPFSQSTDPVAHLLHRATYGVRQGELEAARAMGAQAWLDEQLDPESIDDSELENAVEELFPSLGLSAPELIALSDEREDGGWENALELKKAALYRAVFTKRQLQEVMVEFWTNHFSIYHFKDVCADLKTVDDREVIRPRALGRFRDLLHASAKSPAMLYYLDNYANVADGPNENYGRELMELHTIGVDAGYTQRDVEEVARCFTGWTITIWEGEGKDGLYRFDRTTHDEGPKTVLGTAISGGRPGHVDGKKVLDLLARHPACARFISTKLCRRFVADVPPASVVDKAAATFRATDGDIKAVLRTILTSDEFFAAADQKLKRPFELVVSALRTLGVRVEPAGIEQMIWPLYPLGQVPFEWEPPNGYPDVGGAWANTNGMLNRWNFASALVLNWFDGVTVETEKLVRRSRARTPAALVDAFASRLLQRSLDPADRDRLVAYTAGDRPPGTRAPLSFLNQQAPGLLALLLSSPYFQWR